MCPLTSCVASGKPLSLSVFPLQCVSVREAPQSTRSDDIRATAQAGAACGPVGHPLDGGDAHPGHRGRYLAHPALPQGLAPDCSACSGPGQSARGFLELREGTRLQTGQGSWVATWPQSHLSASHSPLVKGDQVWFLPSEAACFGSPRRQQWLSPPAGLFLLLQKVEIPASQQVPTRGPPGTSPAGDSHFTGQATQLECSSTGFGIGTFSAADVVSDPGGSTASVLSSAKPSCPEAPFALIHPESQTLARHGLKLSLGQGC